MKKELWLIWKNPNTRRRYNIGTLTKHDNNYSFKYNNIKQYVSDFDYFPGFPDLQKNYNSSELFTNIINRLPNPNRPDYEKILKEYGLNVNSSKMDILEKTRGRLITDTFEFVKPFNKENINFEVAGIRHCNEFKKCKNIIKEGERVFLDLEPENKYDKDAIAVKYEKLKIGYVPRYYSLELAKLLKSNVKYNAYITHLNIQSQITDEIISIEVELL